MTENNNLVADLVNANLDVIEEQVLVRLPKDIFDLAKAASDAIGETARVLSDDVKPDGPQVASIWRNYVNQNVIDFAAVKGTQEAEKINSEILRNLSTLLVNPAALTLKALTDEVTDNGQQLEGAWKAFLLEGNNLDVLLENTIGPAISLVPNIGPALAPFVVGVLKTELVKILSK